MTIAVDLGYKATKQTNKMHSLDCLAIKVFCTLTRKINPFALKIAKILWSFGYSELNRDGL